MRQRAIIASWVKCGRDLEWKKRIRGHRQAHRQVQSLKEEKYIKLNQRSEKKDYTFQIRPYPANITLQSISRVLIRLYLPATEFNKVIYLLYGNTVRRVFVLYISCCFYLYICCWKFPLIHLSICAPFYTFPKTHNHTSHFNQSSSRPALFKYWDLIQLYSLERRFYEIQFSFLGLIFSDVCYLSFTCGNWDMHFQALWQVHGQSKNIWLQFNCPGSASDFWK